MGHYNTEWQWMHPLVLHLPSALFNIRNHCQQIPYAMYLCLNHQYQHIFHCLCYNFADNGSYFSLFVSGRGEKVCVFTHFLQNHAWFTGSLIADGSFGTGFTFPTNLRMIPPCSCSLSFFLFDLWCQRQSRVSVKLRHIWSNCRGNVHTLYT